MITSTSNPQMKQILQLQKKAKARWQQRVFVVEGPKMVWEAPREWLQKLYVSCHFSQDPQSMERLEACGCSVEVVADAVFKAVSSTQTPQGILALLRMPSYTLTDLLQSEHPHLLVLEGIQDPGNLGTMLRTAEGAGADGIILDRTTVDLYNPKTIRATMGSVYRMPVYIADGLEDVIPALKERGITACAAHLEGAVSYDVPDYTKGTAFLIGNEGNGLTAGTAALADVRVRIPMEGKVESLNAAIAATLLMYEANRQRRQGRK